jgi:hypothetical protein
MKRLLLILFLLLAAPHAHAAIAFDTAVSAAAASSWSHTVTGSNTALVVQGYNLTDCSMTATYNGVAMNLIGKTSFPGSGRQGTYLFLLLAPATGSHTVALSCGHGVGSSSYTGAAQTGQPDSSAVNITAGGTTPVVMTTTVVGSGTWLIGAEADGSGGETANAGTTVRKTDGNGLVLADSNGTVGTGSRSLSLNVGTTGANRGWIVLSLAAAAASPSATTPVASLVGGFLW